MNLNMIDFRLASLTYVISKRIYYALRLGSVDSYLYSDFVLVHESLPLSKAMGGSFQVQYSKT